MRLRLFAGAIWLAAGVILAPSMSIARTLSGLSDNSDCAEAETTGVVISRKLVRRDKEIEGFRFKDSFGESYINVSLPEAMPAKTKLATHAELLKTIKTGAKLKLGVLGCGAAARIEVLSSVAPAGR